MKLSLLLSASILVSVSHAQEMKFLEGNNVRATISNSGAFFNNSETAASGYESPKDEGNHLIYASSFWFGAKDEFGNLKMAADLYGGEESRDTYPGALKNDGSAEAPVEPYAAEIYVVSKAEIEYHVSNIYTPGYIIPHGILAWPAHGDVMLDLDFQLAPFADLNGNGIYEPEIGEYPEIRGDHAAYMIMNDRAGTHGQSGGDPLGIEIHYMFYQYETEDEVDNTTFVNARIINRSSVNYPEFIMSAYMDFDIGYGSNSDDYVGCNPTYNYMFGYNGDVTDEGGGGQPGYGDTPPAIGFMLLNREMNVCGYYENSAGPYGTPNTAADFWNYQNAIWKNGLPFQFGGNGNTTGSGVPSNFMFPSDPTAPGVDETVWSEVTESNPAGDRRVHMSAAPTSLMSGETACFDFAIMTSSRSGNHLENASALADQAPIIQSFYDAQPDTYCDFTLGMERVELVPAYSVYPNPSNGAFQIQAEGAYQVSIYALDGRKVFESTELFETTNIQTDFAQGTYLLVINQGGQLHSSKIIIQ